MSEPQLLFGPFSGKLSNQGGRLALEKPLAPDAPGDGISWVIVDEVFYADNIPWATTPDGFGNSLHRMVVSGVGADPASWSAGSPSPGAGSVTHPDMVLQISNSNGQLKVGFELLPWFAYTLEYKTNSLANPWLPYAAVTHPSSEQLINLPTSASPVFFRLRRDP